LTDCAGDLIGYVRGSGNSAEFVTEMSRPVGRKHALEMSGAPARRFRDLLEERMIGVTLTLCRSAAVAIRDTTPHRVENLARDSLGIGGGKRP
jgi:hypothetical protein